MTTPTTTAPEMGAVKIQTEWLVERRAKDNGDTWTYVNSAGSREALERWLPIAQHADPLAEFRLLSRTVVTLTTDWRPVPVVEVSS